MAISMVEEKEVPEGFSRFTLTHFRTPADAVGKVVLASPGEHPKCRMVKCSTMTLVMTTDEDQFTIEDGDGNVAMTAKDTGTAIGVEVEYVLIEGQVFERNEAIVFELTTDGNAANSFIMSAEFVSIH